MVHAMTKLKTLHFITRVNYYKYVWTHQTFEAQTSSEDLSASLRVSPLCP